MKIFILFISFFAYTYQVYAQDNPFGIDNKVYAYYDRCEKLIKSKEVLPMIDTLFHMAKKVDDKRMQAVALSKYVDHYYYLNEGDSLKIWVNKTKEFARDTDQPKYYYFVWGRSITYYIKRMQYNLAFVEINAMLKDAYQENYLEAVADGYKNMGIIYDLRNSWDLAVDYYQKSIKIIEDNNIEDFNISLTHSVLGRSLLNLKKLPEAKQALDKGVSLAKRSSQMVQCKINLMQYYIYLGDAAKVKKILDECEKEVSAPNLPKFKKAEVEYLIIVGKYEQAEKILEELDPTNSDRNFLLTRAELYKHMDKHNLANICLKNYIDKKDSIDRKDANIAFGEFAQMLDVDKLNKEKTVLELAIQKERLQKTKYIIISLALLLLVGMVLYVRTYTLNKKLKQSKKHLLDKNRELIQADKLILHEKEKAEKASGMKTVFIQNMSHEIRTPLNSILGFSQMLTELLKDNVEVKEYTDQISDNSDNLLKLLGDVIEMSKLDSISTEISKDDVDIDILCHLAIEQVNSSLCPGVAIEFIPAVEKTILKSNEQMISVVVSNLLHNAAKFTPEGCIKVECSLSNDKKWMQICVSDTGIGVPLDKQELVFERFVKLNDFSQGFGLGLSISRLSAQLIGGSLAFDKDYTDGCRVVFTIPLD